MKPDDSMVSSADDALREDRYDDNSDERDEATAAERQRFSSCFGPQRYQEKLAAYLQWRRMYQPDENNDHSEAGSCSDNDVHDWERAVDKVWSIHRQGDDDPEAKLSEKGSRKSKQSKPFITSTLDHLPPQLLYCHRLDNDSKTLVQDTCHHTILHCLPAQINLQYHTSDLLINILALYLHSKMNRHDYKEQFTLMIDVRPGKGWPNPPATSMISLMRHISHALYDLFPQRLYQCIVYNVPRPAVFVYKNLIQPTLHASLKNMILLAGGANLQSVVADELHLYLEHGQLGVQVLEKTRKAAFL